ncbi:substrate-binding domain-containing protein [Oleiharenicola lentus]|uniref:substrate-binding domain-containing protein n=1 Tax=Oleiharenicola lentus TaxID=2508720 RepID=UPI003F6674A3
MDQIPKRHSLVSQVVEILETGIGQGTWQEWLPSERELSDSLHVSRNTLRAAISQLEKKGRVQAVHPVGTRVVNAAGRAEPRKLTRTVGLLSPDPIDLFRPNVALIMDELRAQLADIGYRLRTHHGDRFFSAGSARALAKLVAEHPHDCWLLVLASEEVKSWFYANGIKCVVSGSCSPETDLPFVDLDYRALSRHAAGQMIAAGHRRLAFFMERSNRAGIIGSQKGFLEGVSMASSRGATGEVVQHQRSSASIIKALTRMFGHDRPPTAILVTNPNHYLMTLTYLQHRGLLVPRDVSLVCTDDDPFLSFVHPQPSRYAFNAHTFARHLFRLLMLTVEGEVIAKKDVRIMPSYVKGATLAEPPLEKPRTK